MLFCRTEVGTLQLTMEMEKAESTRVSGNMGTSESAVKYIVYSCDWMHSVMQYAIEARNHWTTENIRLLTLSKDSKGWCQSLPLSMAQQVPTQCSYTTGCTGAAWFQVRWGAGDQWHRGLHIKHNSTNYTLGKHTAPISREIQSRSRKIHHKTNLQSQNVWIFEAPVGVYDFLQLPTTHIAHSNVVDFATANQVIECMKSLLNWSTSIPAMDLRHNARVEKHWENNKCVCVCLYIHLHLQCPTVTNNTPGAMNGVCTYSYILMHFICSILYIQQSQLYDIEFMLNH